MEDRFFFEKKFARVSDFTDAGLLACSSFDYLRLINWIQLSGYLRSDMTVCL